MFLVYAKYVFKLYMKFFQLIWNIYVFLEIVFPALQSVHSTWQQFRRHSTEPSSIRLPLDLHGKGIHQVVPDRLSVNRRRRLIFYSPHATSWWTALCSQHPKRLYTPANLRPSHTLLLTSYLPSCTGLCLYLNRRINKARSWKI